MSGTGKSEQEHVPHFLHKNVNRTFHVVVIQVKGKEMYKRKCAAIRPIVVFFHSSGQGHSTTVFCKISVRRSKFRLEFSFTWLKISR